MTTNQSAVEYRLTVHHIISDLLVGLHSDDAPEVRFQSGVLNKLVQQCPSALVRENTHKIEQASLSGDFDTVSSLIFELEQLLQQQPSQLEPESL